MYNSGDAEVEIKWHHASDTVIAWVSAHTVLVTTQNIINLQDI